MRVNLKRVCLLIDTKWGMKPRDRELIDLMERYINHEPLLVIFFFTILEYLIACSNL
jgi:GTP-binding protein EngB required for normal cell division